MGSEPADDGGRASSTFARILGSDIILDSRAGEALAPVKSQYLCVREHEAVDTHAHAVRVDPGGRHLDPLPLQACQRIVKIGHS